MKLVKMGLALVMAVAGFNAVQAQTADEIITKYLVAQGGKDKLEQVKTLHMENTTQAMGNEGPSTVNIISGTGYKLASDFSGQSIIMVITDKGGWQVNPYGGATTPTALPDEVLKQSQSQLDIYPLLNYAAKGSKVELTGKEAGAYKLKVTDKNGSENNYFIDSATYHIVKSSATANFMGQNMEVTSSYSDFKPADMGIVFPYSVEISYGGQFSVTTTVKIIEINKTIDPSIFVMPKS